MEDELAIPRVDVDSQDPRETSPRGEGEYATENSRSPLDVSECRFDGRKIVFGMARSVHPEGVGMDQGGETAEMPVLDKYWRKQAESFAKAPWGFPGKIFRILLAHIDALEAQ